MQAIEAKELLHINGDRPELISFNRVMQALHELLQANQELLEENIKLNNENAELKAALERLA